MAPDGTEPADLPRLGSVFGRYRIDALVGRGGMGVVFRATDLSLQRPVALKLLSPDLASDPSFRARFERESRLAAAIEHPALVPIYEAGAIGDTLYIAMRFVPGRDLGSILQLDAPLDLDRTLALARQVAGALDAAHRRGLIHRDVKPANILVEPDGEERAYLADFGLTRRLGDATMATRRGPLATIDYVAPEQVAGGTIDGRADQYGLACVVVHCLTGAPPFDGESDAAVLFAHVDAAPPHVSALDPRLPAVVDEAIVRALQKSPDDRFADCRSFVAALGGQVEPMRPDIRARADATAPTLAPGTAGRRRGPLALIAVLGVAIVVVAGVLVAVPPSPTPDDGGRLPSGPPAATGTEIVALGPLEGEVIYFASDVAGDYDIYAIDAASERPRRLTRASRWERQPAVSPDGTTIAYVVGIQPSRDVWLMDADGRNARALVTHAADDADPSWSEDGRSVAFASDRTGDFDIFEIRDRGDGLEQRNARNVTGRPAIEQLPDWAPGGRRMIVSSNHFGGNRDLVVIDVSERAFLLRRTSTLGFDLSPAYAPDGGSIAFDRRTFCDACPADRGQADLYTIGAADGRERRLTDTATRDEIHPAWAPDGRALVYAAGRVDAMELFTMTPDGGRRRRLTSGWSNAIQPAWALVAPSPARSPTGPTPPP